MIIPGGVERVSPVHALAVSADLNHLRTTLVCGPAGVCGLASDPADVDRSDECGVHRITDVVLTHLPRAPAGNVEEPVVQGQVNVGDQRRHRSEALEQWRQIIGICGLGRDCRGLLRVELTVLPPPRPDRALEVGGVDDDAAEAVLTGRVVGWPHLQGHLVILTEVDGLHVASTAQIPEVEAVTVLVAEQVFGDDAVLELWRQPPF